MGLDDNNELFDSEDQKKHQYQKVNGVSFLRREAPFIHKSDYFDFFEGYSFEKVPSKKGTGSKIQRTYIAQYFIRDCSDRKWLFFKIIYPLLFIIASGLFIWGVTRPATCNSVSHIEVTAAISAFSFVITFINLLTFVFSTRKLTLYHYKSIKIFGKILFFISGSLALLTSILLIVYMLSNHDSSAVISIICSVVSSALFLFLGIDSHRAHYSTLDNPNKSSDNAIIIK